MGGRTCSRAGRVRLTNWFMIAMGVYLIFKGLTSKTLLAESDTNATEEERTNARATPLGRFVVTAAGLGSLIYGVVRIVR
jgi:hypothetical protein